LTAKDGSSAPEVSTESWIELPAYIDRPLEVYVNGIVQQPGVDFELIERALVFPRELVPEVKMSRRQWALVTVGIGNYRKHDSVDVIYEKDGRRLVATGLRPR
jgi:hypothetical protein